MEERKKIPPAELALSTVQRVHLACMGAASTTISCPSIDQLSPDVVRSFVINLWQSMGIWVLTLDWSITIYVPLYHSQLVSLLCLDWFTHLTCT